MINILYLQKLKWGLKMAEDKLIWTAEDIYHWCNDNVDKFDAELISITELDRCDDKKFLDADKVREIIKRVCVYETRNVGLILLNELQLENLEGEDDER